MDTLSIETVNHRTVFPPGGDLDGVVSWQSDSPARSLELRLFWHTTGRGRSDVQVVAIRRFDQPADRERRDFHFVLPDSPYSFSGKIINLQWALELIAQPSGECCRFDLAVSPSESPIALNVAPSPWLPSDVRESKTRRPWLASIFKLPFDK